MLPVGMNYNGPARRINFTQDERMRLISLVEKHKITLVGRSHDVTMSKKKADVWREITAEFNLYCTDGTVRDIRQLRKCWENMKTRFRKLNPQCTDAQKALLNDSGDGVKLSYSELGPTSLTPQIAERMTSLIADQSEASSSGHTPFVDSILHTLQSSLNEEAHSSMQMVKTELSPSSSVELVENDNHLDGSTNQQFTLPSSSAQTGNSSNNDSLQIRSVISVSSGSSVTNTSSIRQTVPSILSGVSLVHSNNTTSGLGPKKRRATALNRLHKQPFIRRLSPHGQPKQNIGANQDNQPKLHNSGKRFQARSAPMDAEKALRMRLLRARIKEQELRVEGMWVKMRQAGERHEAILALLRRRTEHYEAQLERMRGISNGAEDVDPEFEFEEDMMWDVMQ
uniref:Myb/SANT-like DNA-binding domain-containing protein 3 n=1 Tax=Phallusia mammillata TaxID=59560 RepID=A0A6F9DM11_9ASCI|nr:myb/SANT-like DNA-binding domain-containing protein 3 [Phallusia mammillata]